MKYSKPEIVTLGNAAVLVEGNKAGHGDDAISPLGVFDSEFDD